MAKPGVPFAIPSASEFAIGILILFLVAIIVLPLPEPMIDIVIAFNFVLGIILLMMALYVQRPLDMAAFPSVLLMGTLMRLALSIAATRSILSHGSAGGIIDAFGQIVTGGGGQTGMVVGVVIFIIITIVQFMVITKGSERIAEVGARFALDAMPGKQMTIDADFNQGLISADEAIKRREDLQRESALFGSMDGAMKFVKGDAIAGILITIINAIGGLAIGMGIIGLPLGEALNKYTILTIGDGLCAQLPALMMSVACGIMMSRSTASSSSLGKDLVSQLQGKPYSLIFATFFLIIIAGASPFAGMPWYIPIVFLVFAIFVGMLALNVFLQSDVQQQMGQLEQVKQDMNNMVNPNRMYERLGVDILSVQVGNDLLRIADPEQDGQLLGKIAALRSRLTDELGYILPNVRIMDSPSVLPQQYLISIRNNPVAVGSVYPDYFMVLASQFANAGIAIPDNVIRDKDPSYEMDAVWMLPDDVPPELQKHMVEATDAVINHLQEISVKYVDEILSKMDVLKLMEMVRQQDQSLIQELIPTILSPNDLRKIFVNLIRERVSIKDVMFVFERLSDYARFSKEPDVLSERLRAALGRQICIAHADGSKQLYAVTLSNDWERVLDDSCQRTELGTMFLLNPIQVQELIDAASDSLSQAQQAFNRTPIILCSPRIRLPLFQLLDRHIPQVVVMSYSELIPDIQVQAIGTINTMSELEAA